MKRKKESLLKKGNRRGWVVGVTASVIICGFGWGHPQAIFLAGLIDAGNPFGYIFFERNSLQGSHFWG